MNHQHEPLLKPQQVLLKSQLVLLIHLSRHKRLEVVQLGLLLQLLSG
jgi:hypothetical protein